MTHHPKCNCAECWATRASDDYWGTDDEWVELGKEAMSADEFDRLDEHLRRQWTPEPQPS